nr:site-specific integrase [Ideonella oryzae]
MRRLQTPSSPAAGFDLAWGLWQQRARARALLRKATSEEVYASVWRALAQWACARLLAPHELHAGDLAAFLAEREASHGLTRRHAWRITRLVERVLLIYHQELGLPASQAVTQLLEQRPDIRYANASRFDELPDALSAHDAALLARHVARPTAPGEPWQDTRNRAAVALHLGAGLTPAEVRALRTKDLPLITPLAVHLAGVGAQPARHVPLPAWAGRSLHQWRDLRATLGIPGDQWLPSTRSSGKPWGKVSHHEGVKSVLAQAGLDAQRWSAYSLRHSFALHALHRRVPPPQIGQWLGVTEPDVLERYQRIRQEMVEEAAWLQETS